LRARAAPQPRIVISYESRQGEMADHAKKETLREARESLFESAI
jgi:hypothetical protein